MNARIIYKKLVIANILLFAFSVAFLEYSKLFGMSMGKHWIYSFGHCWWFMIGIPAAFLGSLILGILSLVDIKEQKFLYSTVSLVPLILFIIFISI
jgi:hypothetical protein